MRARWFIAVLAVALAAAGCGLSGPDDRLASKKDTGACVAHADVNLVEVHVSHLRDKLEDDPARPAFVQTVRGVGYAFAER